MENYLDNNIRKSSYSIVRLFTAGGIALLLCALLIKLLHSNSAFDFQFHDSYFVIRRVQILLGLAITMALFALLYFAIPKIAGKTLNSTMGKLHFWITIVGILIIILSYYFMDFTSTPRRYYEFESFDYSNPIPFTQIMTIVLILILVAQLIFVINVFYSLMKKNHVKN